MNKSIINLPKFREMAVDMILDHEADYEPKKRGWTE